MTEAQDRDASARHGIVLLTAVALGAVALSATAGEWLAYLKGPSPGAQSIVPPGSLLRSYAWLGPETLQDPRSGLHLLLVDPRLEEYALEEIAGFARAGATVWILAASPGPLPTADAPVWVLPGPIVAHEGAPLHFMDGGAPVDLARTYALAGPSSCRALVQTDAASYRDANEDGRVSVGEPTGPFDVACVSEAGSGAIVVLAVSPDQQIPADLLDALEDRRSPGEWRVVDGSSRPSWDVAGGVSARAASAASFGEPKAVGGVATLVVVGAIAVSGRAAWSRVHSLVAQRKASKAGA